MPSLDRPCLLLPRGCERSTVYACVPVDVALASESSVLETLMEYDGIIELPDGVSFDGFEHWSTTVGEDASTLSLEELSAALQVGDKLSANNTAQLAEALAEKLKATHWKLPGAKAPIVRAFLSLSKDMQQLVFTKLRQVPAQTLFSWPVPLQQAYSDRWVTPSHGSNACEFSIGMANSSAAVLSYLGLLSRTDPSLPGLTSLSIYCDIPTPEAASLLSSTLLHHPAIAKLDMPRLSWAPCDPGPPAAAVFRTLPQLTAITSLTLSAPCLPPSPPTAAAEAAAQAVHAMAAALSALRSLASFTLYITPGPARGASPVSSPPRHKRCRVAACMGPRGGAAAPPSIDPVITALSTAPALTAVTFSSPSSISSGHQCLPCSGVIGPFTALKQLKYVVSASDAAGPQPYTALLDISSLPALTLLVFSNCPDKYPDTTPDSTVDSACVRSILASVARQPALSLAGVYICPRGGRPQLHLDVTTDTHTGPAHVSFNLGPCAAATAEVACAAISSLAAFTAASSLEICLQRHFEEQPWAHNETVVPALRALTALTGLKSLEVHLEPPPEQHVVQFKAFCIGCLAVPLRSFKLLQELSLNMPSVCAVPLAVLAEQIAAMTQLRSLSVGDYDVESPQEFEAAFAALTALTHFVVAVRPVTAALVRSFASVVSGMPHLGSGDLQSCEGLEGDESEREKFYAAVDWAQGLLDLPCRGSYQFMCSNAETPSSEVECVRQQLIAQGARVADDLQSVCFAHGKCPGAGP